jgi:hypothetical protein
MNAARLPLLSPGVTRPGVSRPVRPSLAIVPSLSWRRSRVPFVVAVVMVLTVGLVGLLLLNTVLAQDAYVITGLQQRNAELIDRQQRLEQEVAKNSAPEELARRARKLGMVPSSNPAFLRLPDGRLLGVPVPP